MKHQRFWPDPSVLPNFLKERRFGYRISPFGANAVTVVLGDRQNYVGRNLLGTLAESTALASILPDALAEIGGPKGLIEDISEDIYLKDPLEATGIEGVELELRAGGKIEVRNGFSKSACFNRVLVFDPRMIHDLMLWLDPDWSVDRVLACCDHEDEDSTLDFLPKQDEEVSAANDNIPVSDSPDVIELDCDAGDVQEVERFFPLVVVNAAPMEEDEEVLPTEVDVSNATANPPRVIYLGSKRNDGQEGDPCDSWEGFKPTDRLPRLVLAATQRVDEVPVEAETLPFLELDLTQEIDNMFLDDGSSEDLDDAAWDGCMAGLAAVWRSRRGHMAAE